MEWLIFGLVCWAVIRFLAPGRFARGRWAGRRLPERRERRKPLPEPPKAAPETAEERLRRQYVEGTLTAEEYERELDALYRAGG